MLCNDKNTFLFGCALIASQIHKVLICDAMISAEKWFLQFTSDDLEKFEFHRGTPRKGAGRDGVRSSTGVASEGAVVISFCCFPPIIIVTNLFTMCL